MSTYKRLVNNSLIFAVGNLGSKVIAVVLIPLYTHYLTITEYGTIDLITSTVTLLLPLVSASIFEAVLRFVMDKSNPSETILTTSFVIGGIGFFTVSLFYPILSFANVFDNYLPFLYIILLVQIIEKIFAQYTRAINKVKIYAVNGILLTFSTGILNILFLILLDFGIYGYFWAMILAYIISIIFLNISSKSYKDISFSNFDKDVARLLLNYSIPMIPNSLMWWLINTSSKYFILLFSGVVANGLFAVASKIPLLVNLINQIFSQAWQLSAIEEYENENKSNYYSTVFEYLSSFMFIGTSFVLVLVKILFKVAFADSYFTAWKGVPFLLIATVFSAFSAFLGTNYIAAKETKGVLKTSFYGGIISLGLNLLFIPTFGFVGAGVSSMISFIIIFLIRYIDTKKYIKIEINWKLFVTNVIIIAIQIVFLWIVVDEFTLVTVQFLLFSVVLFVNKILLRSLIDFIISFTKLR